MKRLIYLSLAVFFCISNVSAYIDPGTGGMILGSAFPIFALILAAVAGFLLKFFYNPVKRAITLIINIVRR